MRRQLPRLHAVTNDSVLSLPDFRERAVAIAQAGPVALHIRSGTLGGRQLNEMAVQTRELCAGGDCLFFVNDRADVARTIAADGVHLPGTGLSVADARSLVGPEAWIGRSAHSIADVTRARSEGADYVFLGPIWKTGSHPNRIPIGPEAIFKCERIPVIAIGGVTAERVVTCLGHGAYGVAVVSALWHAPSASSATQQMLLSFDM